MAGRSQVATVLFTDMVASTATLSRLPADAADAVRRGHFAALRGALAVHRGHEVKTTGDGLMVVFESARDALGCAVTMQQAIARRDDGIGLRVGISAGDVTLEAGDYFGMPVVEAARLCDAAPADAVLAADVVKLLAGAHVARLAPAGPLELKGISNPLVAWRLEWDPGDDGSLRVALADDSVLLREGMARVLEADGIDVVLHAGSADELFDGLAGARPHVVVLDVRMPPTHTTEGLDAAERIRDEHPGVGVLVLSASVNAGATQRLLADDTAGVGYLLKDCIGEIGELASAIRTIAGGGSAIDAEVVEQISRAGT